MDTIPCARCGQQKERQAFRPFPTEFGAQLYDTICRDCWGEWLKTQQQLINHYALVPHQPKAKAYLMEQLQAFLDSR